MAIQSGYTPNYGAMRQSVKSHPQVHKQLTGGHTMAKPAEPVKEPAPKEEVKSPEKTEEMKEKIIEQREEEVREEILHDTSSPKKRAPSVRKKVSNNKMQIRDFPRDVMDIVRGVVPGGNSYVETLLAYIYVTSPTKFDIPSHVQEIVDAYEQTDPMANLLKEIRLLREQLRTLEISVYQGTIASECTLMDLLGFRKEQASNPADMNYMEVGVEDMHIALENSAKQMKKKDNIRHGRKPPSESED